MAIAKNAKELGEAIKRGDYPIRIEDKDVIESIKNVRKPSNFAWAGCLGAICGLGMVFTTPLGYAVGLATGPGALCAAGIGAALPIAVLGKDTVWMAVNVFCYGGGKDALSVLRTKGFRTGNDVLAYLG